MLKWLLTGILLWPGVAAAQVDLLETPQETFQRFAIENVAGALQAGAEAAGAKIAANAEFDAARKRFFAACSLQIRDSDAERAFAKLLLSKDLYYLSLYAVQGMDKGEAWLNNMDRLTAGSLDGGIAYGARDLFRAWVEAVRHELHAPPSGILWLTDTRSFLVAVESTMNVYKRYVEQRDTLEFDRWRRSIIVPIGAATTPQDRARAYTGYIAIEVDERLKQVPPEQHADAEAKLPAWLAANVRAVTDFETVDLNPQVFRSLPDAKNYDGDLLETFVDHVSAVRRSTPAEGNHAFVDELGKLMTTNAARRGQMPPFLADLETYARGKFYAAGPGALPPEQLAEMRLEPRWSSGRVTPSRLTYLDDGPGKPFKFNVTGYYAVRGAIVAGTLRAPLRHPPPGEDACTWRPSSG